MASSSSSSSTAVRLRPSDVHFSMGSIPQEFGKGRYTIVDTFRRLVDGETTPDDIRPVTVFRHQNKFWAYSGNQRLYVFRKLEEFGMIESIPVNILNRSPFESGDVDFCKRKFTTVNGGRDVTVRGPDGFRMADLLSAIYRNSTLKRRQRTPSESAQQQHVGKPGNGRSISALLAKRRPVDSTYLKMNLWQWPASNKQSEGVRQPTPSPYPPSPAIIEHVLPYCVVLFVLIIIVIVFLLLYLTL